MKDETGSDSLAVQLVDEKHWDELVIIIAVVCNYFLRISYCLNYYIRLSKKTEKIIISVLLLFLCCLKISPSLLCFCFPSPVANLWLIYKDRKTETMLFLFLPFMLPMSSEEFHILFCS